MKPIFAVLYHANCYDGFGAAWAAHRALRDKAEYIPVAHGKEPPEDLERFDTIYIVDFSYPAHILDKLASHSKIVILDHHKTAEETLRSYSHPNVTIEFDMNRSGAGMTWDYFFPFSTRDDLIDLIEDRDLWRFSVPGSKEVHAALVSYPMDFEVWSKLNVEQLKTEGSALVRMYDQMVERVIENAWLGEVGGHQGVAIVNTSFGWSEIGNALCKKFPNAPFAATFTEMPDCTMWSLRSVGDFDVSAVAKQFGGGGHKNAAGFKVTRDR